MCARLKSKSKVLALVKSKYTAISERDRSTLARGRWKQCSLLQPAARHSLPQSIMRIILAAWQNLNLTKQAPSPSSVWNEMNAWHAVRVEWDTWLRQYFNCPYPIGQCPCPLVIAFRAGDSLIYRWCYYLALYSRLQHRHQHRPKQSSRAMDTHTPRERKSSAAAARADAPQCQDVYLEQQLSKWRQIRVGAVIQ